MDSYHFKISSIFLYICVYIYPISRSPNTLSDVENLIDKIIDSKQKIPPSVEKFKSTQDSEVNKFLNPPYHLFNSKITNYADFYLISIVFKYHRKKTSLLRECYPFLMPQI